MRFSRYKYDVFVSHAVEDKLGIANDLCKRLEEAGLSIWYSGMRLRVGDSIEETIFENLPQSRYAVVIFSQYYLSKNWTMKEYYYLQNQEREKRKIILPILYDVTIEHLKAKDVLMADKFAIPFSKGMDYVVEKLLEEIKGIPQPQKRIFTGIKKRLQRLVWVALSVLLAGMFSWWGHSQYKKMQQPDIAVIEQAVRLRMDSQKASMEKELRTQTDSWPVSASIEEVTKAYAHFNNLKAYYRNEYEFANGYQEFRFKKNVETVLHTDLDVLTPYNKYGFNHYTLAGTAPVITGTYTYVFTNTEPVEYTLGEFYERDKNTYSIAVTYTRNLRAVLVNLVFPEADKPKRSQVFIYGFLPVETYTFQFENGQWVLAGLE